MIDANRNNQTDVIQGKYGVTILIEESEDHTVIDNPPGFPTKEELDLIGVGDKMLHVEIDETSEADG